MDSRDSSGGMRHLNPSRTFMNQKRLAHLLERGSIREGVRPQGPSANFAHSHLKIWDLRRSITIDPSDKGFPKSFCAKAKLLGQITAIAKKLLKSGNGPFLATRRSLQLSPKISSVFHRNAVYHEMARIVAVSDTQRTEKEGLCRDCDRREPQIFP